MSTVREHIAALRSRAEVQRRIAANTGMPWPDHLSLQEDREFQFQAVLLCSVHLDELERLAADADEPCCGKEMTPGTCCAGCPNAKPTDWLVPRQTGDHP